ncbi:MAG: GntR family transcriptional regulator [Dehalococcoidales bacterium]|nr:GntR family transcriptional regulator [Dehalococcoidales bacterium]
MDATIVLPEARELSDHVYDLLKDEVLSGRLAPGRPLLIVELARQLGVSRTPVKDALNKLSAEGLVDDVPRKGYFVSRLDASDVAELMDAALILVKGAAELAVEVGRPEYITEMQKNVADMASLIGADGRCTDYATFFRLDHDFHLLLFRFTGNRRLASLYDGLNVQTCIMRIRYAEAYGHCRILQTIEEHRAMVRALELRNVSQLMDAVTFHNRETKRQLVDMILSSRV